jgi:chromosome segregation ATPase
MNKEAGSSPKSSYSSLEPNQNQNRSSENRVKELEAQVKELLRQKKGLEHRCGDLEKENKQLQKTVREAGRQTLQSKWTNQDEEEFLNSRHLRLEEQNLVKAPLMSHMEKVNYTYDIKNQWCMSDKPHFDLRYPRHFQRAPTLDKRDKQDEEKEAMVGARDIPTIHTSMPAVKLTFESHGKKQKEDLGAKNGYSSAKRNSFAALKKLALKSH